MVVKLDVREIFAGRPRILMRDLFAEVNFLVQIAVYNHCYRRPSLCLAVLCFHSKTGFWPS